MVFTVNKFAISQLNNQEFCGFMLNLQKQIASTTSAAIGIEEAVNTAFNDSMRKLVDQVYTAASSTLTIEMRVADTKRSVIYRRLRHKLGVVNMAEEGSSLLKLTDRVNNDLLGKYGTRVAQMPMQEKTAVLQGFLYDLHSCLDDDETEVLGIEGDITRLEQANNAFVAAYQERVNQRAADETEKTARLRAELTDLYQNIVFTLQYLANSTVEANAEKTEACQQFVKQLNVLLNEVRSRYLARKNRGNEVTDDEGASGNDDAPSADGETPSGNDGGTNTGGGTPSGNGGSGSGNGGSTPSGGGNVTEF